MTGISGSRGWAGVLQWKQVIRGGVKHLLDKHLHQTNTAKQRARYARRRASKSSHSTDLTAASAVTLPCGVRSSTQPPPRLLAIRSNLKSGRACSQSSDHGEVPSSLILSTTHQQILCPGSGAVHTSCTQTRVAHTQLFASHKPSSSKLFY